MTKPISVIPLTLIDMESLPTHRLLAFLRKLHKCEYSIEQSDWEPHELVDVKWVVFKSSEEWQEQHELVKSVLATRSDVEKGGGG